MGGCQARPRWGCEGESELLVTDAVDGAGRARPNRKSVAYQSEVLGELSSSIETQNRGGLVGHDRLRPPHPSQVLHLGAHAQKGHMRSPRVISTDLAPLLPVWGWCLAR